MVHWWTSSVSAVAVVENGTVLEGLTGSLCAVDTLYVCCTSAGFMPPLPLLHGLQFTRFGWRM